MNEQLLDKLKNAVDIVPDKHDGSYELVRETVEAYASMDSLHDIDYNDLELLYYMAIGTWQINIDKKKKAVSKSHLPNDQKTRLISLLDKVQKNADITLIVNNFKNHQGEIVMKQPTEQFSGEIRLPDTPYMIADVRNANGADNNFVENILPQIKLNNFYGFSAWNTSANTLGTLICAAKIKFNAKECLQEYTQSQDKTLPEYNTVKISGPPHQPCFEVEVVYKNRVLGRGKGQSKKEAQQNAAYEACKALGLYNNA